MRARSCLGSLSHTVALTEVRMGGVGSVLLLSRVSGSESMVLPLLMVLVSKERMVSAMLVWALEQLTFAGKKTSTVAGKLVLRLSSGCTTAEITSGGEDGG